MKKKTKIIITLLCALAIIGSAAAYAAVNYGSESDPLITKSYLEDILVPGLEKDFDEKLNEAIITSGSSSTDGITVVGDEFTVLSLSVGQTVICKPGCEFIPRIGKVSSYGSDFPAVIDTSSGGSHGSGVTLQDNHLYMVTIEGCGLQATSGTVIKILIKGSYTVK